MVFSTNTWREEQSWEAEELALVIFRHPVIPGLTGDEGVHPRINERNWLCLQGV